MLSRNIFVVNKTNISGFTFFLKTFVFPCCLFADIVVLFFLVLQNVVRLIISLAISFGELLVFKSLVPEWMVIVSGFCFVCFKKVYIRRKYN